MSQSTNKNWTSIAVIGAGHMGSKHIQKIVEFGHLNSAYVSHVVEPSNTNRRKLSRLISGYQKPNYLTSIGDLCALPDKEKPDAVIVAVPAIIHVETAAVCIKHGFHVLVEKPLGFSLSDCQDLEKLAVKHERLLQVGMIERWSLCHLWGDWRPDLSGANIICARRTPFLPRVADTDVVHDLMIHDIDLYVLLENVFGLSPIKNIRSWGKKLRSELFDYVTASMELEDGSLIRFFASRISAYSARGWEMAGNDWHASIDFMNREMLHFNRTRKNSMLFDYGKGSWPKGDPLGLEIEAFVQRIQGRFDKGQSNTRLSRFCDPQEMIPSVQSVGRTHEIIDEILGNIEVV